MREIARQDDDTLPAATPSHQLREGRGTEDEGQPKSFERFKAECAANPGGFIRSPFK